MCQIWDVTDKQYTNTVWLWHEFTPPLSIDSPAVHILPPAGTKTFILSRLTTETVLLSFIMSSFGEISSIDAGTPGQAFSTERASSVNIGSYQLPAFFCTVLNLFAIYFFLKPSCCEYVVDKIVWVWWVHNDLLQIEKQPTHSDTWKYFGYLH